MITNIDQLKNFILWCKDNKVKKIELDSVKFEISELDFIPEEASNTGNDVNNLGMYNTETLVDTLEEDLDPKDDPDLYWSSST